MSNDTTVTFALPAEIVFIGADTETKVDPRKWEDAEGFAIYLMEYAGNVILQRSQAGKSDDPEKAATALKNAIDRLTKGTVPSGGGFKRLSDEDYAMKEALQSAKVKFTKGETVEQCLVRVARGLVEVELPEDIDAHEDIYEAEGFEEYTDAYDKALDAMVAELIKELKADEVYIKSLEMRQAKNKTAKKGKLIGKLKGK